MLLYKLIITQLLLWSKHLLYLGERKIISILMDYLRDLQKIFFSNFSSMYRVLYLVHVFSKSQSSRIIFPPNLLSNNLVCPGFFFLRCQAQSWPWLEMPPVSKFQSLIVTVPGFNSVSTLPFEPSARSACRRVLRIWTAFLNLFALAHISSLWCRGVLARFARAK